MTTERAVNKLALAGRDRLRTPLLNGNLGKVGRALIP